METLEHRRVLAIAGTLSPAITGTVFQDTNGDGVPSVNEEIENATIQLFQDDGDGVFEPGAGDLQIGGDQSTDADGVYCFDNLDLNASYFVFQPAQQVNGNNLEALTSVLTTPGMPDVLIDRFMTSQIATATPPAPSMNSSTQTLADETEVIGRERDIVVELTEGDAAVSVEINPFGMRETMQFNANVGAEGSASIIWDGEDENASVISTGLNGRDLTNGGRNTGIAMIIGSEQAGSTARVRLFQGSDTNFSGSVFHRTANSIWHGDVI